MSVISRRSWFLAVLFAGALMCLIGLGARTAVADDKPATGAAKSGVSTPVAAKPMIGKETEVATVAMEEKARVEELQKRRAQLRKASVAAAAKVVENQSKPIDVPTAAEEEAVKRAEDASRVKLAAERAAAEKKKEAGKVAETKSAIVEGKSETTKPVAPVALAKPAVKVNNAADLAAEKAALERAEKALIPREQTGRASLMKARASAEEAKKLAESLKF